jgi:shikimate dehydrogenase
MYFYRLTGYNTDYIGFRDSLLPLLNPAIHRKALILGTGGASKAVAQALQDLHISWQYVSRTPGENRLTYDLLTPEVMSTHQLIVNASPVGTFPHSDVCPDIPYQLLTADHLLYDLVYNPEETLFLKKGKAQGTLIKNGREMLEIQAGAAWEIWSR